MKHLMESIVPVPEGTDAEMPWLDELLLTPEGHLNILPMKELAKIPQHALSFWCHQNARYTIPSLELIDWLQEEIRGREAIEIGAGMGDIGRWLGIQMTDKATQEEDPEIRAHYERLGAAITVPPPDVERIGGNEAVIKYKPAVVIASWVTQCHRPGENYTLIPSAPDGVDEEKLWRHAWVQKYIHIGNAHTHENKRLCHYQHDELYFPFIFSRGRYPSKNVAYVWDKRRGGQLRKKG